MDTRELARQAIAAALPRQQAVARKRTAWRRVLRALKLSVLSIGVLTALPVAGHYALVAWDFPLLGMHATAQRAPRPAPVVAVPPEPPASASAAPAPEVAAFEAPLEPASAPVTDTTDPLAQGLHLRSAQSLSLIPANPKYPILTPREELTIAGVITAVVRKYR